MARASKYQDSITRFIMTRSPLSESKKKNNKLNNFIKNDDHVASVVFLTVLNNKGKNINASINGYHMSAGITFINFLINVFLKQNEKLIPGLVKFIHVCLSRNICSIEPFIKKNHVFKLKSIEYLEKKLGKILKKVNITGTDNIRSSDIIKCNFDGIGKCQIRDNVIRFKKVDRKDLDKMVEDKYGSMCQIALVLAWLFSDNNDIKKIEKIGIKLGYMIKIADDFRNIADDLLSENEISYNYLINFGVQESFEIFINNKCGFIQGCYENNIYTNTIKEIIELLEYNLDGIIDKSSPDIRSQITL